MDTYGAIAYSSSATDPRSSLSAIPSTWALRVNLDYEDDNKIVLIYDVMPSEDERKDLMLKLQTSKGPFSITVVEADGTEIPAPRMS